ncbi:DUF4870 domain-containing protein [Luteococcus sp. Sow4_B9]|uniref:DUF4870 domain-containing protein n=1 Tax=Luteococcus sp. Sow4_B9 TaxID=3438792 RepID=UPI003F99FAA1
MSNHAGPDRPSFEAPTNPWEVSTSQPAGAQPQNHEAYNQWNPGQQPHPSQQPPTSPYGTAYQPAGAQAIPPDDRSAAALAHASTLISMVISAGWLSFVGPLVIWMLYKDKSPYVRKAAAGAFNFNIWVNIAMVIGWILTLTIILAWIGIPLMIFAAILQVFAHVRACLRALNGEEYTYRKQLRILT